MTRTTNGDAPGVEDEDAPGVGRSKTTRGWGLPHAPALDGLRGLAVAAVLGYHLELSWMSGGFLGVSLFFTLSGYLITSLLLAERDATGSINLTTFWERRARRLLPAALAGMTVALVFAAVVGQPEQLIRLPAETLAAILYVANWRFIFDHSAYGAHYLAPSPILHYWSLAIEEQLYLVFPIVVLAATRRTTSNARLAAVVGALMLVSIGATLALNVGADGNRIYFGTDTRMFELLVGAALALAMGFPLGGSSRVAPSPRGAGLIPVAATVGLWTSVAEDDGWLYRGGLWGVSVVSCGLIAGALKSPSLGRALAWPPLRALGRISYGVYVYHWPLFLLLDRDRTGLDGPWLIALRLVATGIAAGISYRYLESPIRFRTGRFPRRLLALGLGVAAALPLTARALAVYADDRAVAVVGRSAVVLSSPAIALPPFADSWRPTPPLKRVLFMGDSILHSMFPTLSRRLEGAGVRTRLLGAPGQTLMTHRSAWLLDLAHAVGTFDPDVVVLESCCGAWPTDEPVNGADGRPIDPDSPAFYARWRMEAIRAISIASARGAAVLWVLAPPARASRAYVSMERRIPRVNEVYASLSTCGRGVGFADWRGLSNPDGAFSESLRNREGEVVRVRTPDGLHLAAAGIDALTAVTLLAVRREWANNGGRPGPWRGTCPFSP
ncbi:MAG: acyltransferase family protein [Deltaproteobacteria bacterium]|nr:acyltransferase family protein [Myxococcales bacterium]MDP3213096.1 acyltransferase family protein [Deltaproteobacteria bacterium]